MYTYSINIARLHPVTKRMEHWGNLVLSETSTNEAEARTNEAEARSKFDRIVAAFPAPGWSCTLSASPIKSWTELDRS